MRNGRWFDRLIPARCALCAAACPGPIDLCAACAAELPWIGPGCARCGLPLPAAQVPACGACLAHPPRFAACVPAFAYAYPVRELLLRFKQGGDLAAGRVLGALLARRVAPLAAMQPAGTVLVPMPLHPGRLAARGFNQAAWIARVLAHDCGLELAPWAARRHRLGREQKHLSAAERRINLRGAFSARACRGRHAIVVDDVLTTGASADALAGALLEAGAADVSVWCVARAL